MTYILPTTQCPCGSMTFHTPCVEADYKLSHARTVLHSAQEGFRVALEEAGKVYTERANEAEKAEGKVYLDTTRP